MITIAIDVGHGFVKGLNQQGDRLLMPSLIAPATSNLDLGPLSSARFTTVQWGDRRPVAYWVGEVARLHATSLFGSAKASDPLTRDLTVIAAHRLRNAAVNETAVSLSVGVPLAWFGRERAGLQQALQGTVTVDDDTFHVVNVSVFPQGVAAVLTALPSSPAAGLYGLVDVGYRTTDYLVVQVNDQGLPTVVPGLAGSWEIGIHQALQEVATKLEQQWKVSYAPHELAANNTTTVTVRGTEIMVAEDIRQAYARLGTALVAKLQTVWAPILPRLRALYVAGGGSGVMPRAVGDMPIQVVPESQWANVKGYLAALVPAVR